MLQYYDVLALFFAIRSDHKTSWLTHNCTINRATE